MDKLIHFGVTFLASAKVIVEGTMKEHDSINATILDINFNKIVEYRNGTWR